MVFLKRHVTLLKDIATKDIFPIRIEVKRWHHQANPKLFKVSSILQLLTFTCLMQNISPCSFDRELVDKKDRTQSWDSN